MASTRTPPLRLTRDQLAAFLQDHEQIKAFENLFAIVEAIAPDVVAQLQVQLGIVDARSTQALTESERAAQALAVMLAACEAKATLALQQTESLRQLAELVAYAPPPRELKAPRYGVFYDTTTQTAAAINTAYAVTFNTTDLSFGVARGSPTSRIIVDREGIYDFQFSAQLDNTSGGNHLAYIWCRVNGVDVAQSAAQLRLKGNDGELVAAWNYVLSLKANDYFELMWSVSDTALQIIAFAAAAPVPDIPSVILTVTNNIAGQHT